MAAMRVYGNRPRPDEYSGDEVFTAAHAAFQARSLESSDGIRFVMNTALYAVCSFEQENMLTGLLESVVAAIRTDFENLRLATQREKWGKKKPVPPEFFGPLWPNGAPEHWPKSVKSLPKEKPPSTKIEHLGLPQEVVDFFKAGRQLDYDPAPTEVGPTRLKPLDHLQIEWFPAITHDTPVHDKDPHKSDKGAYHLQIVDLIGEAQVYDPDGLLAWFCDYQAFGSCDEDHGVAKIFPNASWSDIVADPAKYLDAPWNPASEVTEYLEPWTHCEFKTE